MTIFKGKVGNGVACCIAGDNNRKFANKRDVLLQDGARDMNLLPRFVRVGRGIQGQLSFPVVSESRGFKTSFSRKTFLGGGEFGCGADNGVAGCGKTGASQEIAFPFPVLADVENGGVGIDGSEGGEESEGFDGKIFKFVGDDLAGFGEAMEGGRVVERCGEGEVGNGGGGAGGIGIEDSDAIAHPAGGEGEHSAELTTADDADRLTWRNHGRC